LYFNNNKYKIKFILYIKEKIIYTNKKEIISIKILKKFIIFISIIYNTLKIDKLYYKKESLVYLDTRLFYIFI